MTIASLAELDEAKMDWVEARVVPPTELLVSKYGLSQLSEGVSKVYDFQRVPQNIWKFASI